uniref:Phosphodiesterase n=1 Tax=Globodera rostochiensis TaxID=31243 RepID=A0A914H9Q1_GLORO
MSPRACCQGNGLKVCSGIHKGMDVNRLRESAGKIYPPQQLLLHTHTQHPVQQNPQFPFPSSLLITGNMMIIGDQYGFYQLVLRKHACRLRYVLHQLNSGQLSLEDLKRNIEYAALVLETAYMDETRRICDEDDDLAEVTPEAVPDEVREWLTATFTRQAVQTRREKPKFKSVANAIRTGIFFEKIYRRTQTVLAPIPNEYLPYLRQANNWNFDTFDLNEVTNGHSLKYVGFELFNRYGFLERFKINVQVLENFLLALELGYSKHNNPYHNTIHAADVTQTSHWMLSQTGLASTLTDLEMLAVLFGALIHDYEHTGHTNNFHIQSGSNFALLYNDRSVLENHHASSVFRLMKDDDKNIFDRLTKDEHREMRTMIIEIVLATDMSTHFVQIKTMKNMLTLPEGIDKMKALCLIVHACDISHASKPWELHHRWTEGVLEEFFRQGDLEASMGLPYSPLCDRHTVHVADSQIGFIDFIVEPTMVVCGEMLVKMVEPLVSLPTTDCLFPPTAHHGGPDDGSASATSLSPLPPDLKSPAPGALTSVRKIPINYFGKLDIPCPWTRHLQENKAKWRERALNEEVLRNKSDEEGGAREKPLTNGKPADGVP